MHAMDQVATAKIVITRDNSVQQPEVSAFGGKNNFKSAIVILSSRIVSSSNSLSYNIEKLRQTTTLKREQLKNAALDDKKLKFSAISVELEGN